MTTLDLDSNTNQEFMLYHFYLLLKSLGAVKMKPFNDLSEKEKEELRDLQSKFEYPCDKCPECGTRLK